MGRSRLLCRYLRLCRMNGDQQFRILFESSPDAIFIEDLKGYVLDCNPAAAQLHQSTVEKMIGRHVSELVPPERRKEIVGYDTPSPTEFEGYSLTDTGAVLPVSIRVRGIEY